MTAPVDSSVDHAPIAAPASARSSTIADVVALTKPRITFMVVLTALGGLGLAARLHPEVAPSLARVVIALAGTALIVAGANALNMYLERDSDALMQRTRTRPLPAGRLAPEAALRVGLALSALSVPLLTFGVNATTGLLAAIALVSYVLLYTPLKRRTTAALLVGAVPGAMPPLLGWTAVTGHVEAPGAALFAVMFLWQVPHFLAIATFRRDEYRRAGLQVLPNVRGDKVTRVHIVLWLCALVGTTLSLPRLGVGGPVYVAAASVLGLTFIGWGAWGFRAKSGDRWARSLFLFSMAYLVLLIVALSIGA